MKAYKQFGYILFAFALLTGCSNEVSDEENTVEEENSVQTDTEEMTSEEQFIKDTIDSINKLKTDLNTINDLLTDMDVSNQPWESDMSLTSLGLANNTNKIILTNSILEEDAKEKYSETIDSKRKLSEFTRSIYDDLEQAGKTYDKKLYQEIQSRINKSLTLADTTLDNLDKERYQ